MPPANETIELANIASPEASERVEFMFDSGALNSVVPSPILERLDIVPLLASYATLHIADSNQQPQAAHA